MAEITTQRAHIQPKMAVSGGYRDYVLFMLAVVAFFNYLDRMVLSMLVEPIKADLGFSDGQLGLLTGFAFALFYATFGIPIARLADTRSRVTILSVCMALWSAMTAACGLAQNFLHMLLARVGVGVGEAGCVPSGHSLLTDYVPAEQRALALGIFQTGGAVGIMAGLIAAGWLADQYGWRATFFIVGIPGVVLALVARLTVRDPPRGNFSAAPEPEPQSFKQAVASLFRRRTFVHIVVAYSLGLFGVYGIAQWIPAFFVRVHGMTLTEVGWGVGIASGLGGAVGTFLGSVLAPRYIARERRWEVWWPAWAYLVCIPVYAVAFVTGNAMFAFALVFVSSLVAGTSIAPGMASVQSVAEPHQRATAVAIVMFCSAILGQGLGPTAIGFTSDYLTPSLGSDGLRWALLMSLALFAWAWVHFMIAARTVERDRIS
ncbi:MAG: MFS transporter [Gammaproteobacteria bacterium]|nr:MFS transporter [Gammaproteobacteria bacterium]MDE0365356.1 MFS transporter [Gammaproteobacteria bacterium]